MVEVVEWSISSRNEYIVKKQSKLCSITDSLTIIFMLGLAVYILFSFLPYIPHLSPTTNFLFSLDMFIVKGKRMCYLKISFFGMWISLKLI